MTTHTESITIEDLIDALKELGGEANWGEIRERVVENKGGILPLRYSYWDSYVKTIFQVVQQHCCGYEKYKGIRYFEKVKKGRFRLLTVK